MLLNRDITADSQLLWRRNIIERPELVAPFLHYDQDPYIVIGDDGQLFTGFRMPIPPATASRIVNRLGASIISVTRSSWSPMPMMGA